MALTEPTPVAADDITVVEMTDESAYSALEHALSKAGLTESELRAEAREWNFSSGWARLAWILLDGFVDPRRQQRGGC
jgi:hypothetical protein